MKGNDLLWSRYNFIVQSHGNEHLYNSYSNCLLKLDRHLANSLNALQNGEPLPDNIIKDFSCEEIEYFKKNKILVENDDDLVEILHTHSMARLFSNKSFVLTIAPTHSCNFDCSYCYEQFRMSTPMTDKTANAIVDYIDNLKKNNGLEVLYITWYGGEPLMQLHRVCSLSKKLNSLGLLVKENNIITNGYFLTEANTRELVDAGINEMQITLDGNRITHDSRRHLKNGNGSYDVIIQNLDSFFSNHHDKEICLSIRVNIDKTNYEDYISTYRQLRDRYANHNFIIYPGIIFLDEKNACSHSCMSRNEVTDMFLSLYKKHGIIRAHLQSSVFDLAKDLV